MASRRNPPGQPPEGTPEYDWLYGSASGPAEDETRVMRGPAGSGRRPDPEPEHTRVMPVVPPEDRGTARAGSARGSSAPGSSARGSSARGGSGTPPPRDPRRGASGPPAAPRPRRRPRIGRIVLLVVVAWLVFLLAVPFWALNRIDSVDAFGDGERPAEQPGNTYLIVGSDSRADLSEAEREDLGTGGATSRLADTIMVLHTGSGPDLLMSIPRDSIVDIPGHSRTKINAAYAWGGPELLVRTVETNTGIRIDDYVEIGFGGFVGLVDAVGGVEICPKSDMVDPAANLDIVAGCQEVDGKTALGYARSRKTSGLGDIARAEHQREVVAAVGQAAVSPMSVVNPVRYVRLARAASDFLRISEQTGPLDLARFAMAMTKVNGTDGLTCGVPISDLAVNWDSTRAPELFGHVIADDTDSIPKALCTPSGLPR